MGWHRNTKPRPNAVKQKHSWCPQRLLQDQVHKGHYSQEDKEDAIWLIDNGYHPLDVAIMLGMRVFRQHRKLSTGTHSNIYQFYSKWAGQLELANLANDITAGR